MRPFAQPQPTGTITSMRTLPISGDVLDMDAIRGAKLHMGVDPLGGAGVHYWGPIAERYGLDLTVVNDAVDPTFRFITVDWDGKIRMDPSSPYAMQSLIKMKDRFDPILRLRYGPRPARNRHQECGADAPQPLSFRSHLLSFSTSSKVARGCSRREDWQWSAAR